MLRMILGVFLLLGGGLLCWLSFSSDPAKPVVMSTPSVTKILIAAEPLQAGTLLKEADLKEREIPSVDVTAADFVAGDDSRAEVRGAMLRRYLDAGQAVRRADILRPRDRGFLATVLAPGTRAVSIGVDATTGASGLISPGDLVDVILTQEFARGETTAGRRVVAETVLSKVRVIAVDQQIAQGAPSSSVLQSATSSTRIASNVSLQVTPEQAGRIIVAGHLGRLTLAVRSIDMDQPQDVATTDPISTGTDHGLPKPSVVAMPSPSTFGSDVSAALSNEAPAMTPKMRVIQGEAVSEMLFK